MFIPTLLQKVGEKSILKKRLIYPRGFPIFFSTIHCWWWCPILHQSGMHQQNPWNLTGITYQNLNLLIRFFGPFNYNTVESFHQLSQPLPWNHQRFWRSLRIHPGTSDHKHVSHPVRILNPPGVHVTPNELGGNVEVEAAERFADPKSSLGNAICVVRSSRLRYKFTALFFFGL